MPQIRAVMSGLGGARPRRNASKNRGGSKMLNRAAPTRSPSRVTLNEPSPRPGVRDDASDRLGWSSGLRMPGRGDVERREHPVDVVVGHAIPAQERDQRGARLVGHRSEAAVAPAVVRAGQSAPQPARVTGPGTECPRRPAGTRCRGVCIRCIRSIRQPGFGGRPASAASVSSSWRGRWDSPAGRSRPSRAPRAGSRWPGVDVARGG